MTSSPAQPRRRPTMTDVADRAGVSLKTVSRVVNREPYVSDALAARVNSAIAELGFRPHTSARQLAAGAGKLLGYVQVDAANPFFASVYRGLEDAAQADGYLVIAGSTDADPDREASVIETLIEARVAGMVVAAAEGGDDLLRNELQLGTAIVLVDRVLDDLDCDTVVSDNRDSTRQAVTDLIAIGHERVAFLGGTPTVWTARERLAGYREAMTAAHLPPDDPNLVMLDVGDLEPAAAATRRLVGSARPPTAILAAQDRIGMGVIQALHDLGLQHQVALTVFDDIPMAEQLDPTITVIAQNPYRMGQRAGTLLLRQLAGAPTTRNRHSIPVTYIRRQSSAIPPVRA